MTVAKIVLLAGLLGLGGCKVAVNVEGNGGGIIQTADSKLYCGNVESSCEAAFKFGEKVTLVAAANDESAFVGWRGDCEGQSEVCELSVSSNRSTIAIFERPSFKEAPENCDTDAANALCLQPTRSAEYYIEQSVKYFLTMDSSVSLDVIPNYSEEVVRWEWPPWLLLTGLGRFNLIWTDAALKLNPTSYAYIDCQAFDTQPFGRCYVVFDYSGTLCPIYEEFTFNDQGEMTFIEAWTDMPGWTISSPEDPWAEGHVTKRLANRVPGLGNATGRVDWNSAAMLDAAARDADVAELVRRANDPYRAWAKEAVKHIGDVTGGCDPDGLGVDLEKYR